jgi:hypothetical protein
MPCTARIVAYGGPGRKDLLLGTARCVGRSWRPVRAPLVHLHRDLGFSLSDLSRCMVTAAAHSFQPEPARATLIRILQDVWPV